MSSFLVVRWLDIHALTFYPPIVTSRKLLFIIYPSLIHYQLTITTVPTFVIQPIGRHSIYQIDLDCLLMMDSHIILIISAECCIVYNNLLSVNDLLKSSAAGTMAHHRSQRCIYQSPPSLAGRISVSTIKIVPTSYTYNTAPRTTVIVMIILAHILAMKLKRNSCVFCSIKKG